MRSAHRVVLAVALAVAVAVPVWGQDASTSLSGFIARILMAGRLEVGAGSPESARTAPVGSVWLRSDGGAGTSLYVKESGAGNTGWVGVGGVTVPGSDTQVVFNDGGVLGADAGLVYDKTTDTATLLGHLLAETVRIEDSDASHRLIVKTTSNLTADRDFTFVTGDAARTLTLTGNATLNQDVSTAGSPTFPQITLGTSGILVGGTNLIEQRNGTSAQGFHVYRSFTSATDFDRLFVGYRSADAEFYVGQHGQGASSANVALTFGAGGGSGAGNRHWSIVPLGHLLSLGGNIGDDAGSSPPDIYAETLIKGPRVRGTTDLALDKITASASAPGAGLAKFEVVCGTNAGTAKLIMYAGTSTTSVTVVDNVGSGVTGC